MVKVLSPVFGTLAMQSVEEGAMVEEGEAVGEVEAMKVFVRCPAPAKGKVHWIAELGEVVGDGDEIAEIIE